MSSLALVADAFKVARPGRAVFVTGNEALATENEKYGCGKRVSFLMPFLFGTEVSLIRQEKNNG